MEPLFHLPSLRCHKRNQNREEQRQVNPLNSLTITLHTSKGHGIDKYPAKSHAQRLASKLGARKGLIVLSATPATTYPDSDQPVPFRQDRYFFYLSGCNEPGCYITYDIAKEILTLWLPAIDEDRVVWTGRGSTVEEALEKYDVDEARYISGQSGGEIYHNVMPARSGPIYAWRHCLESIERACYPDVWVRVKLDLNEESGIQERQMKLKHALDACRVIKDEHEVGLIRQANEITAAAHTAVLRNLHRFTNEAEVEAIYTATCIARHARSQGYSPIAGSGPNASVLHYDANNEDFGDRQMLVLDAGCEVSCYASDVTRSFPLNKLHPGHWPSKEAEEVYKLVEKIQEACIKEMKPGKSFVEISFMARKMTIDGLLELGILKGDKKEILVAGTSFGFFPHGLGHHLGLEVHDVSPIPHPPAPTTITTASNITTPPFALPPRFNFATSTSSPNTSDGSTLEPGMVVTIEPGVYFNHFLLEQFFLKNPEHSKFIDTEVLDRYWKVGGVRIEDDILVTRDGYENLTTAVKGEEMLGVIREGASGGGRERGGGWRG